MASTGGAESTSMEDSLKSPRLGFMDSDSSSEGQSYPLDRVSLEDREPRPKQTRTQPSFEDDEKVWKSRAATLQDRKTLLAKLVSRQKSMRDGPAPSRDKRRNNGVGLNIDSDSDENDDINRKKSSNIRQREKLRSYLLETRSGLPPKEANAIAQSQRQQHVQHYDMELMRRMDAEAFADISSRVGKQCAHILSAPDVQMIKKVCVHAQTHLSSFGIDQMQLWYGTYIGDGDNGMADGNSGGSGSDNSFRKGTARVENLECTGLNGTTGVLKYAHVMRALNVARDEGHYGVYNGDYDNSAGSGLSGRELPGYGIRIATIRPDDLSWDELERAMRVVGGGKMNGSKNSVKDEEPPFKKWYAIHLIVPALGYLERVTSSGEKESDCDQVTDRFVMLVAESVVSTNTVAISNRMPHSSPYKVKSLFLQECLRRLVAHIALRMFQVSAEKQMVAHACQVRGMVRSSEMEAQLRSFRHDLGECSSLRCLARVVSKATINLYHGLYARRSGNETSGEVKGVPGRLRAWVMVPSEVESSSQLTAFLGHVNGNFLSLNIRDVSKSAVLRRAMATDGYGDEGEYYLSGDSKRKEIVSSIPASELVAAGLTTYADLLSSECSDTTTLPDMGPSLEQDEGGSTSLPDYFVVSIWVPSPSGALVSPRRGLILLLATPLLEFSASAHSLVDQDAVLAHARRMADEASKGVLGVYTKLKEALTLTVSSTLAGAMLELDLGSGFKSAGPFLGAVVKLSRWITGASSMQALPSASPCSFVQILGVKAASLLISSLLAVSLNLCSSDVLDGREAHNGDGFENDDASADGLERDNVDIFVDVSSGEKEKARIVTLSALPRRGDGVLSTAPTWLMDLRAGHVVQFGKEKSDAYDHDNSVASGHGKDCDLLTFVRKSHPRARDGCVVPIFTAGYGLSLVIVVLHYDEGEGDESSDEAKDHREDVNYRSDPGSNDVVSTVDMSQVFEQTRLGPKLIAGTLRNAISIHQGQIVMREHWRAREIDDMMSGVLVRRGQMRNLMYIFGRWKQYRLRRALEARKKQMETVLDLLALPMAHAEGDESSTDEEDDAESSPVANVRASASTQSKLPTMTTSQRVMSMMERHVSQVFSVPLNSVTSGAGTTSVPDALLNAPDDCYVARTTAGDGNHKRAVLIGLVRRPDQKGEKATLGWIRVMRSSGFPCNFSALDVQRFSHLCEVSSMAYTAMKCGLDAPRTPGNVQALMLPVLSRMAPLLFDPTKSQDYTKSAASLSESAYLSSLHEISVLFKHLCGSEVALLRLRRSPFLSSTSLQTDMEAEEPQEFYVSSEDSHIGMNVDFTTMFSSASDARNDVTLDRAIVDRSSSTSHRGEIGEALSSDDEGDDVSHGLRKANAAQIVLQIMGVQGENFGEVKVLGPLEHSGFTPQQQDAARVLAYILSGLLGASKTISGLQSSVRNMTVETQSLTHKLSRVEEEHRVECVASGATRSRLSSALGLGVFCTKLRQISSLPDLSAYIHATLPALLGVRDAILALRPSLVRGALGGKGAGESVTGLANVDGSGADAWFVIVGTSLSTLDSVIGAINSGSGTNGVDEGSLLSVRRLTNMSAYPTPSSNVNGSHAERLRILLREPVNSIENTMGRSASGAETAIPSQKVSTSLPFGALILSTAPQDGEAKGISEDSLPASRQWEGMEDLLGKTLSDAILGSVQYLSERALRASLEGHVQTLESQMHSLEKTSQSLSEQLSTEAALLGECMSNKAGLEVQVTSLIAQTQTKDAELEAASQVRESIIREGQDRAERLQEQISRLESTNEQQLARIDAFSRHGKDLESMVVGFAGDQRAHRETVSQWLAEYSASLGLVLLQINQAVDGTLHGAADVRGVLSAAGEAIRTANTLEIQTYYSPGSSSVGTSSSRNTETKDGMPDDDNNETVIRRRREDWARLRKDGDRATVLVVPNKCINMSSRHDNACYLFIKASEDSSTRFTDSERCILTCAAGLCARALLRASSKYSFDDMRIMEQTLKENQAALTKLRHSLNIGESVIKKECASLSELQHEVEAAAVNLLGRGAGDICSAQAFMWYLPADFSISSPLGQESDVEHPSIMAAYRAMHSDRDHHVASDLEAIKTIFSTEPPQPVHRAGMLWCPVLDSRGKIVALLRAERKLSAQIPTQRSRTDSDKGTSASMYPGIDDIIVSAEEVESVHSICRQSTSQYARIMAMIEAKASIDEAADAITTLQGRQNTLESALHVEEYVKSKIEMSLQAGADLMGAACAKRLSADQLIDSTRKAIMGLVSDCEECYLVLPAIQDVFPDPNFTGGELLALAAAGLNDPDNGLAVDCSPEDEYNDDKTITKNENKSRDVDESAYFTIEGDIARPLRVDFQSTDLELAAMRTYRTLAAGRGTVLGTNREVSGDNSKVSGSDKDDDSGSGSRSSPYVLNDEESAPIFGNGHASGSWAIRRMFSRISRPEGGMEAYHSTAVPFPLLSGNNKRSSIVKLPTQAQAVAVVVKRRGPVTRAERDCVLYLARVFTYCLEMWVGKGSINEALGRIERLNREIERLRAIQRTAQEAEVDTSILQMDLCTSLGVDTEATTNLDNESILAPVNLDTADQHLDGSQSPVSIPYQDEFEAQRTIVESAQQVFMHLECEIHNATVAGIAIGNLVPMNSPLLTSEDSSERKELDPKDSGGVDVKHSLSESEAAAGSAFRGQVRIGDGKCSYWVGRTSTTGSSRGGSAMIYLYLSHSSYPCTWISVSGFEKSTPPRQLGNTSLRVAIFLKLLSMQAIWRIQLFASRDENKHLKELCSGLMASNQRQEELHKTRSEALKEKHGLEMNLMHKVKADGEITMVTSLAAAQSFFCDALLRGREVVRSQVQVDEVGEVSLTEAHQKLTSSSPWLLDKMSRLVNSIAAASGWNVSHGLMSTPSRPPPQGIATHNVASPNDSDNSIAEVAGLSLEFEEEGLSWTFSRREIESMGLGNVLRHPHNEHGTQHDNASSQWTVMVVGRASKLVNEQVLRAKKIIRSLLLADSKELIEQIGKFINGDNPQNIINTHAETEDSEMNEGRTDEIAENVCYSAVSVFSAAYPVGSIMIPLRGRMLVMRPPREISEALEGDYSHTTAGEDEEKEGTYIEKISKFSSTNAMVAASSLGAMLLSAGGVVKGLQEGLVQYEIVRGNTEKYLSTEDELAVTNTDLADARQELGQVTSTRDKLRSRLTKAQSKVTQLQHCHAQNLRYSHRLADLAELSRGINRSCTNINGGVLALWSQSSKLLLSLLASHVVLMGCGLCLPLNYNNDAVKDSNNDASRVSGEEPHLIEYSCRGFDGSEIAAVADEYEIEANVFSQPIEDHGDAVKEQIERILSQQRAYISSSDGRSIHCLSQPSARHKGASEQVWLVPVKTSRHILAVLRVSLLVHKFTEASSVSSGQTIPEQADLPATPKPAPTADQIPAPTPVDSDLLPTRGSGASNLRIRFTPETKMTPTKTEVLSPRNFPDNAEAEVETRVKVDYRDDEDSIEIEDEAQSLSRSLRVKNRSSSRAQSILSPEPDTTTATPATGHSVTHSEAGKDLLGDAGEALEAAQSNLLNFSEVFAPVLLAALDTEKNQRDARKDRTAMLKEKEIANAARDKAVHSDHSLHLLERCMRALENYERTVSPSLTPMRGTQPENLSASAQETYLTPNGRLPLQRLTDALGAALGGTVNLLLKDTASVHITEGDSAFGTVSSQISSSSSSRGSGDGSGALVSIPLEVSASSDTTSTVLLGRLNVTLRKVAIPHDDHIPPAIHGDSDNSSSTREPSIVDQVAVVEAIKPQLGSVVCAIVCALARERESIRGHATTTFETTRLRESLALQTSNVRARERDMRLMASRNRHFCGLVDVANACNKFLNSLAVHTDALAVASTTGSTMVSALASEVMLAADLDSILPEICSLIPAALHLPCVCKIAVSRVGVVGLDKSTAVGGHSHTKADKKDNQSSLSHTDVNSSLIWYAPLKPSTALEVSSISVLTSDDTKNLGENVARSCLSRGVKSVVDVSVEADTTTGGISTTEEVRVLSFPIMETLGSGSSDEVKPLGVLQLAVRRCDLLNLSNTNTNSVATDDQSQNDDEEAGGNVSPLHDKEKDREVSTDPALLDDFLSCVSRDTSAVIAQHRSGASLATSMSALSDELESYRSRGDELEAYTRMWQCRADAWGGVAAAASAILRHTASGSVGLEDILSSEAVAGALRGSGVGLAMIRRKVIDANESGVEEERNRIIIADSSVGADSSMSKGKGERSTIASDFVVVNEDKDISVEVFCRGLTMEPSAASPAGLGDSQGYGNEGFGSAFTGTEANIAPIAVDLVNALSTVIRSCVTSHRARLLESTELKRKNRDLSSTVNETADALRASETSALKQQKDYESQIAAIGTRIQECERMATVATHSMAAFCGPTIREVAVMLEELGTERRPQVLSTKDAARSNVLDWAWEGVSRVADRAMSRVSNGEFGYHVSILVQIPPPSIGERKRAQESPLEADIHLQVFDSSRRKETVTIGSNRGPKAAKIGILSDPAASTLEKALLAGGVHENKNSISHVDLVGIEKQVLSAIFDASDPHAKVTVACIALPDAPAGVNAVLRVVFPSAAVPSSITTAQATGITTVKTTAGAYHLKEEPPTLASATAIGGDEHAREDLVGARSLAKHVLEMTMSLGCAVIHICHHLSLQDQTVVKATNALKHAEEDKENMVEQLNRSKRMHRVVCREACALLDPPLVGPGGQAPRAVHPASLTPLAASQDSCMKILAMARTLLRGEGQALVLRDTTTDPITYQIIYSGNALSFTGVDQGSFGNVSAGERPSLAGAAMHTHKPVIVVDAVDDPRYNAEVDGSVASSTPMIFIPIRGRGSSVIGALIVARGKDGEVFSTDDLAAGEIAVSHGALSLYWCQGLGALHHVLNKSISRLQELESAVVNLRH